LAAKPAESGLKLPVQRMQHCVPCITGTILAILRLLDEANSFENYKVLTNIESHKIYYLEIIWKKSRLLFISSQIFNDIGTILLAAVMPHYWMNRPAT
jgi:hypothetical protein